MDKKDVIAFFDGLAPVWDREQMRNEKVISLILEKSDVRKDADILDVASGTGVLFEDYPKYGVASVTGIDISGEMVKIARSKYPWADIICGDAESYAFEKQFDVIMIYNAFPHFPNPDRLIENLSSFLKKDGRLTVAHGMSMKALEECHSGSAKNVSLPLPEKERLAEMMKNYINVDIMISDDNMYMVSGTKK